MTLLIKLSINTHKQHFLFALLLYAFVVATTSSFCRRQRGTTLVAWVTFFSLFAACVCIEIKEKTKKVCICMLYLTTSCGRNDAQVFLSKRTKSIKRKVVKTEKKNLNEYFLFLIKFCLLCLCNCLVSSGSFSIIYICMKKRIVFCLLTALLLMVQKKI